MIRSLLSRAAAREASIYKSPTLSRARERYCFEDCFFFSFFFKKWLGLSRLLIDSEGYVSFVASVREMSEVCSHVRVEVCVNYAWAAVETDIGSIRFVGLND